MSALHPPRAPAPDLRRHTRELLDDIDGAPDEDQVEQLVHLTLPVARRVAREYRDRGVEEEDLLQVASEALVKAIRRFRPERGRDLLGYAVPTIRGEIRHYFRDSGWQLRPPRRVQELQWAVSRATERLRQQLGREPAAAEVCRELDVDEASYREARATYGLFHGTSLDEPVSDGDGRPVPRVDTIAAVEREGTELVDARIDLGRGIAGLDPVDRRVLRLRFVDDLTQREIGEVLGVTQVTVSRWLERILATLRTSLTA